MNTIPISNVRASTLSMSRSPVKTIAAVITGLVTWIFIATLLNLALRVSWPAYHPAELAFDFTLGMKFARLVIGAISSLTAGFVATWITKGKMTAAAVTGIVLLALFIPDHYLIWHKFPIWYHLTFLLTLLPLLLLGGALNRQIHRKV